MDPYVTYVMEYADPYILVGPIASRFCVVI